MPRQGREPHREIRTVGTEARALLQTAEWLALNGCMAVALESAGSFWKPLYNLLEGQCELLLVNTRHLKLREGTGAFDLLFQVRVSPSIGELAVVDGAARTYGASKGAGTGVAPI